MNNDPVTKRQTTILSKLKMEKCRGYLIHENSDPTSEGFGSHARGVLYPLLHIALSNCLQPVLPTYVYEGNCARDYSVLKKLPLLLSLPQEIPTDTPWEEVFINTWTDPVVGSACGDGKILSSLIHDYLKDREQDGEQPVLVIRLYGALRYMNPTDSVYGWLQNVSRSWRNTENAGRLTIAGHVRVPEDFCPQSWKDDNHVRHLIAALENLDQHTLAVDQCNLQVYTEERFSKEDETLLRQTFPQAHVIRGTNSTVLDDVQALASADILIPSSSHFSALAGYLSHCPIVLSNHSRWEYFQPHSELAPSRLVEASDIGKIGNTVDLHERNLILEGTILQAS
jgi:hypothetical protein